MYVHFFFDHISNLKYCTVQKSWAGASFVTFYFQGARLDHFLNVILNNTFHPFHSIQHSHRNVSASQLKLGHSVKLHCVHLQNIWGNWTKEEGAGLKPMWPDVMSLKNDDTASSQSTAFWANMQVRTWIFGYREKWLKSWHNRVKITKSKVSKAKHRRHLLNLVCWSAGTKAAWNT